MPKTSAMFWVALFFGIFGMLVVVLFLGARRAGPRQLSEQQLALAVPLLTLSADAPGQGWNELGSRTEARGLSLKFDHDDDPQAEATLHAPSTNGERARNTLANCLTVTLSDDFETHHVHTGGYVFRLRMKGTAPVVGKETRIQMLIHPDGSPYAGRVENDDDTDAAVGGWIEIDSAEILRVQGATGA